MLFNTLAYAKFFAIVFVVSWLLANRRWAILLPSVAVAAYALFHPGAHALGLAAIAAALTLALSRSEQDGRTPRPRAAALSLVINGLALTFLTYRDAGTDPATLALRGLGVPLPAGWLTTALLAPVALFVVFGLMRARKVRLLFILLASYVFYAHWDWRFLPLIWGSSTADWLLGNAIHRAKTPGSRRLWLAGTVAMNLGVLGIFKYFNFGVDTALAALSSLDVDVPEITVRIALPVGISFFTFESMSYVIDVYRRHIEPQKSYFEYLSFVAFFPHLVAGPIIRPRDLLPQLAGEPRFNPAEGSEGLWLIAVGLLKKVAIGDYLALNLVDRVFDAPAQYSALECYTAVLGYAVQIYCDFSGYTDIAIGSALLLGVRFPLNFNAPYKAVNVIDFWRRWHISLSTWLRDYLYIPLGGNRKGPRRTYINLMITMLLGGLWHGAAWTFVVWGGMHGVALAITRALTTRLGGPPDAQTVHPRQSPLGYVLRVLFTFHFVCLTWIFFRAEGFDKAWLMLSRLAELSTYAPNLHWKVLLVLAIGLLTHWVPERWYSYFMRQFIAMPAPAQAVALLVAAIGLRKMAAADAVPFVYFQF